MYSTLRFWFVGLWIVATSSETVFGAVLGSVNSNSPSVAKSDQAFQSISWYAKWVASIKPLTIYGKVIDDSNNPVEGAEVDFHWTDFAVPKFGGEQKKKWLATDKQGRFVVRLITSDDPLIEAVKKEGYDFKEKYSAYYAHRPFGPQNPLLTTTEDNPVVLRLRKKGATEFLMCWKSLDFQFLTNESGRVYGYDVIKHYRIENLSKLFLNNKPVVCDFKVTASLNKENNLWEVVLSSGSTNGGVIASQQMLYTAPQDGYQPCYTFTPQHDKVPPGKYIFIRSRTPPIYTCLELKECNISEKFFRLNIAQYMTNPHGDRNLEQATDLPYEVTKQLTDQTETAFRQNKRPTKPDLPKLVKEAKEKAEKGKNRP